MVPVDRPVYIWVTGICTGTAPIAFMIGVVMAAYGTSLAPLSPSMVLMSLVDAHRLPATVNTPRLLTALYSLAMYLSKTFHIRVVDSLAFFDLPGGMTSMVRGNTAAV